MADRKQNRRGNYSMLMGFSLIGILGFGALGVDISYMAMANTQASAVADAASHAALLSFRQAPGNEAARKVVGTTAAQWVVNNNDVGLNGPGVLEGVEYGIFDPSSQNFNPGASPANAAQARVTRTGGNGIDLLLAPIIGVDKANIDQDGITVANPREIVVVVDRSGSMKHGSPLTGQEGTHLALIAFSDYMIDHQVPKDRIGATQFAHWGGWFDNLKYIDGNVTAIRARWSSWQFESMGGCTNQSLGMNLATTALANSGNDLAFKALIVISDGEPTTCMGAGGTVANFHAASSAAWAEGIHVWAVGFGNVKATTMQGATRGLGTFEPSPNSTGLAAIMVKIAESIPVALVD